MQTLDAYRQGIQDGEMWPGDGFHNVVSESKHDKRKKVKYYCERHWQLKAVENQEDAAFWTPAYSGSSNSAVRVRTR